MYKEQLIPILIGEKFKLYGLLINGVCEAEEYLKRLPDKEHRKLMPLLHRTAQMGTIKNEQKFKNIGDGLFEFKGFQSRLFCFFDEDRIIILIHGCIKKRDKLDVAEIKKARSRKEEYFRKGIKK